MGEKGGEECQIGRIAKIQEASFWADAASCATEKSCAARGGPRGRGGWDGGRAPDGVDGRPSGGAHSGVRPAGVRAAVLPLVSTRRLTGFFSKIRFR